MSLRIVGLMLVSKLHRLTGARIVDLNIRTFAAAAGGIDQFSRPGLRLLGQKAYPELLATRRKNRVFGIGILREQPSDWRGRPQGTIRICSARQEL